MGTDSVIYIRTDGNSKIATGHFVRCLCIAEALETLGKQVCFLVSDTDSADLLRELSVSIFKGILDEIVTEASLIISICRYGWKNLDKIEE